MNEKTLTECGLSEDQVKIYLHLLHNGLSPAKQIALKTGIGRALTYKVLDQLVILKLAEKRDDIGKITLFGPGHPRSIKEIIDARRVEIEHASSDFSIILTTLSSQFNALLGKPNVQSFEGVEGIKKIQEDILVAGENILVISSPISYTNREEILTLIKEQVEKQAKQKIQTRAITPRNREQKERIDEEYDKHFLIQRKIVSAEKLNIPAQIIVFGDKVAITNFKESIITVVIESKYISETFKIMFEYIWNQN